MSDGDDDLNLRDKLAVAANFDKMAKFAYNMADAMRKARLGAFE